MLGWIDTLLQGVLLGGLYSLYATGLSVIFGIMRLVNLAHGDLIVLGAFLILAATSAGVPLIVACAVVVPIMFALGYVLQSLLLNRALGRNILPPLLITFGLSIIVQNGLLETFSADTRRLDVGPLQSASLPIGGGIAIGIMPLIGLVAAIAVILLLNALFYRTAVGRAFRATSDDVEIAQLMGINNRSIYALTMGISLAVCALAAHPRYRDSFATRAALANRLQPLRSPPKPSPHHFPAIGYPRHTYSSASGKSCARVARSVCPAFRANTNW